MMKRIILAVTIIFISLASYAQPSEGDGTSGNPYRGTLTSDWTFAGGSNNYFGNLEVSSGTFTVSPGATLRFGTGNSLTISGTGVLSAVGTSGNPVTFTASGTTWGHIVFSSAGTSSTIENCIIEKGYDGTYGGGLYITSSNIQVKNSIFRNSSSPRGGGVCVIGANPFISGCFFSSNSATVDGGGVFTWGSATIIENCLFYNNYASSNGGGAYLGNADNLKITNSTFASNSAGSTGRAIAFRYNRTPVSTPVIKNSIIWGADENLSISYSGYISKNSSIFVNSAIQGYTSGYTNCIGLNATNTASDGPNFINPGPSGTLDLSIAFISPCRDKGTSTGAPAKDYIGNNRIGPVDIGAYEHQYCRWVGGTSSEWNTTSNWAESIVPSEAPYVVIGSATNNPLISTSDVIVQQLITETGGELTIGTGRLLTATSLTNDGTTVFNPGAKGTIPSITNNGTFRLESDATGIASLIVDSYSGNDAEVELYLTGGGANWHYISSPFNYLSVSPFSAITLDLARWVESLASIDLSVGWVAYDGYVYRVDNNPPYTGTPFSELEKGRGYNHFFSSAHTYTLTGQLNTSDVVVSIPCTDPDDFSGRYGFNLLGNPFSSGLDWDIITSSPNFPAQTSKVLHYESGGNHVYYINGTGSEEGVNGIIPTMQGFFTKTYADGNFITLLKSARTHNDIPSRYKGTASIPYLRLRLISAGLTDNTVVRFDIEAKSGTDYDFDAVKVFLPENKPYIYSVSGGTRFAINGLPFPEESAEIPLNLKIVTAGTHTISASTIQNLEDYNISLRDNLTGITTNLKSSPAYTFSAGSGVYSSRFVLTVSKITTPVPKIPEEKKDPIKIYQDYEHLNIVAISPLWNGKQGSVKVFDLSGKTAGNYTGLEFNNGTLVQVPAPVKEGIYLVEVRSGKMRYTGKIVIR